MEKQRVFVTRVIPENGLQYLRSRFQVDLWEEELPPSQKDLLDHMEGVDGLLCLLTDHIDAEVMDHAGKKLKVISNFAVGVDNIDIKEASRRRIPVGNTPGILTDATADLTFAMIMTAGRRVMEGDRYVRQGKWKTWEPSLMLGVDFLGQTLGLIGFGRIGRAVAKRAAGFDMKILYYDSSSHPDPSVSAAPVDLDTLLEQSDIISIHAPLTPETFHLIDETAFARMKPGLILVNTARGPIVDPEALYKALRTNRIFAAALDVTDPEPIPMNHPLLELDNLIITPHIGSASRSTRKKMSQMAAENLAAGLMGESLPNCANPEVYG